MNNYIQILNADLVRIEELMRLMLPTPSDYELLLSLYHLYMKHQNTNVLIDYADSVLKSGESSDQLLEDARELNRLATGCYQLYTDNHQSFDYIDNDSLLHAHMKPFDEAEKSEAAIAAQLWKEYQHLSNRLDFTNHEDEMFMELEAKCDDTKSRYDTHQARVKELHERWQNELNRCTAALLFRLEDLSLVLIYMQRISQSIIDTIIKPKGE